jgi:hypothetical protein
VTTLFGGGSATGKGPLVVTSAIPLIKAWPAEGAETEACDGTRDAMQKILRDALQKIKGKKKTRKEEVAASSDDADDVDLDDVEDDEDEDEDEDEEEDVEEEEEEVEALAPLSQRYTLDDSIALGPTVLVSKPEPVLMFTLAGVTEATASSADTSAGGAVAAAAATAAAVDAVAAVAGGGGGFKGEWHVYENGVVGLVQVE